MLPQALTPTSLPITKTQDFLDPDRDGGDLLFLTVNFTNITSTSQSQQQTVQVDSGVDFYWYLTTAQADIAGAIQTESSAVIPLVNMLIRDESSRKTISNLTLPLMNEAGSGQRPYRFINPRVIRASTLISFALTPVVAGGTTYANIFVVLHGFTLPVGSVPWSRVGHSGLP